MLYSKLLYNTFVCNMDKISIVVPCYNEEETINIYYEEMQKIIKKLNKTEFEIIFVNDGSRDKTLELIRDLSKKDKTVRYISFSRNFGKESAIIAGIDSSTGDYVTTMDVDMQDPPELLIEMYEEIKKGEYDCIATRSVSRNGYSFFRKLFTSWYYKLINRISKTEIVDGARDFRLMTRQMVDSIVRLREYNRYSKGIFSWVGYKTKWITFENQNRVAGTTKWNFFRLFAYSMESILGFSTVPLLISSVIGIVFFIISMILVMYIIIDTLINPNAVQGWPSLVCIIFFVTGIQLFCIGIIGQYLAKMYLEIKDRPLYIVKETEKDI